MICGTLVPNQILPSFPDAAERHTEALSHQAGASVIPRYEQQAARRGYTPVGPVQLAASTAPEDWRRAVHGQRREAGMASTTCTCVWTMRPLAFGIAWDHVVVDPDCAATHEVAS